MVEFDAAIPLGVVSLIWRQSFCNPPAISIRTVTHSRRLHFRGSQLYCPKRNLKKPGLSRGFIGGSGANKIAIGVKLGNGFGSHGASI